MRVDLLDNFSRGVRDPDLEQVLDCDEARLYQIDLLDPDFTVLDQDYDAIFHLAAIIGVAHVLQRPFQVLTHNVVMHQNVLRFAHQQSSLKRLLFASTSEVYAGTLQAHGMDIPTPESTPLTLSPLDHPRSTYMLSKLYGEAMCHHAQIPFTIFRPHNVYGPRMGLSHVIPELYSKIRQLPPSAELEVASLDHRRTFCYVDDAVDQLVGMLRQSKCESQTLNVGQQDPELTIRQLAETLCGASHREDVKIVALPETPGSPRRRCPHMGLTLELTGVGKGIALDEGMRHTIEWYESHVFAAEGISAR